MFATGATADVRVIGRMVPGPDVAGGGNDLPAKRDWGARDESPDADSRWMAEGDEVTADVWVEAVIKPVTAPTSASLAEMRLW